LNVNILFVNNFRGRGGGEEFLRDLLPGLVRKGVQVGLICRPDTPLAEMFRNSGIEVHRIPRSGIDGLTSVFKTAQVIREKPYEIIAIQRGHDIIQSWIGAGLSGARPDLIYIPQVPEFLNSRFLLSRMRKIVTISRYIRDKIIAFHPAVAPAVSIVYYGIDLDQFRSAPESDGEFRKRFGLEPATRVVGTVGDLWKNQIEFLDALVLIRRELPDIRFALAGSEADTEMVRSFKRRAAELGLADALLWAGRLSKSEMKAFYAAVDVAVSTHRKEGFGIWVLEALAMGTPVISVDEGGIRDSLEGCRAGLLVDGGAREMAAAVLQVLTNKAERQTMSDAGRPWVAGKFGRDRMVDDYYQLFASLTKSVETPGDQSTRQRSA
jgi:glycosyltransferase involved in cell wall biosynthesis